MSSALMMRGDYTGLPVCQEEEEKNSENELFSSEIVVSSVDPTSADQFSTDNEDAQEPLKPINTSFSTKEKVLAGPLSVLELLNYFRRRPILVIFLLIFVTAVDLLFFYRNFSAPRLHSMELFLDPPSSDAQLNMKGTAQTSSATLSIALRNVECSYSYRPSSSDEFSKVGEIFADFPKQDNNAVDGMFGAQVELRNTHYSTLRRVTKDFSTSMPVNSELQLNCDVSFAATWYFVIPIATTVPITQTIDIQSLKSQRVASDSEDSGSLTPNLSIEPQSASVHSLEFLLNLKMHSMRHKLNVDTFVVHVPKIVYVTALVDKANSDKSYLRIRTKATSIDLAAHHPVAQIDVKLSCTPLVSGPDMIHAANGSCTLLSPMDFSLFNSELSQKGFLNVTAQSLASNFLTNFLGEYHFLRSVDPSLYPGSIVQDDDSTNSERRALSLLHAESQSENTISDGAKCVTVDSDGVYISQSCLVVEKGFFKVYLGIYNDAGFTGSAESITSWAPSGEAFESSLEANMLSDGNTYNLFGDLFFSIPQQNLTLFAALNQTDTTAAVEQLFLEALAVMWDFNDPANSGLITADSLSIVSGYEPIKANAIFEYGAHAYFLRLLACDHLSQSNTGQTLNVLAEGTYGGDWTQWHWALAQSLLSYEEDVIGAAVATILYDVPGETGLLGTTFLVTDGSNQTVTSSNVTAVAWQTEDGWTSDGLIAAISIFDLYDGFSPIVTWETIGLMEYANHTYQVTALENPFTVHGNLSLPMSGPSPSALGTDSVVDSTMVWTPALLYNIVATKAAEGQNLAVSAVNRIQKNDETERKLQQEEYQYQFLVTGDGTYGGSLDDWHVDLEHGIFVLHYTLQGLATGDLRYEGDSGGASGYSILHADAFYPDSTAIFHTTDIASWTSPTYDWSEAGSLFAQSATYILDTANWNASAALNYQNQNYFFRFNESNYDAAIGDANIAGKARGVYGGSWLNFFATLQESSLVVQNAYVGGATGSLYGDINSNGDNLLLSLVGHATDATQAPYANTQNSIYWSTNSSWLSTGQVSALTEFSCLDMAVPNWDALLAFNYGDDKFFLVVSEQPMMFLSVSNEVAMKMEKVNVDERTHRKLLAPHKQAMEQDSHVETIQNHIKNQQNEDTSYSYDDANNNSTSNYNLYAVALGTYSGSSFLNWGGQLSVAELVLAQTVIGYAMGEVLFDVTSSGDSGNVLFEGQVLDSNFIAYIATLQSAMWMSESFDWSYSGSVKAKSNLYLNSALVPTDDSDDNSYFSSYSDDGSVYLPNWNVSVSLVYGDDRYTFSAQESDYGVVPANTYNLLAEGFGLYGGNWNQWHAVLEDSTLILANSVVGHAHGVVAYTSMDSVNDVNGTAVLSVQASDSDYQSVMNTSQVLHWNTLSQWTEMGGVYAESLLYVQDMFFYNATMSFSYHDHQYVVFADEYQCFDGSSCFSSSQNMTDDHSYTDDSSNQVVDHWTVLGYGNYHGDASEWDVSLIRGQVTHNSALVGYSSGNVQGVSANSDWLQDGSLIYTSITQDGNNNLVLKTDGNSMYSPQYGDYTEGGAFGLVSQVNMPGYVNWNATGAFKYGDHQYSFLATEADYGADATSVDYANGLLNFVAFAEGGYGAASITQAWMSVTDSLLQLDNTTVASVRAYLSANIPMDNPSTAAFTVNVADYDVATVPLLTPDMPYPIENAIFWTNNELNWQGDSMTGLGYVNTQTALYGAELFFLTSEFNVSFVDTNAYFMLQERLNDVEGLDMWARADYDMQTGMIANIGGEVYYDNSLIFGANTAYDMQLQNYDNPYAPTKSPSYMPTFVPSVSMTPTATPTTASPSFDPTFAPTFTPTVAPSGPTLSPTSAVPSVAPSMAPSLAPSLAPTGPTASPTTVSLSARPTVAPTVTITAVPTATPTTAAPTFFPTSSTPTLLDVTQVVNGLNATLFQINKNYSLAFTAAVAACMDGVTSSDIRNLLVKNIVQTTRRLRHQSLSGHRLLATQAASASYQVVVANPTALTSASSLTDQLNKNLANGTFNNYLNTFAVEYGATGLVGCTSFSADIVDANVNSNNDKKVLPVGIIVGCVVGGAALLFILGAGCFYYYHNYVSSSRDTDDDAVAKPVSEKASTPTAPVARTSGRRSDSNASSRASDNSNDAANKSRSDSSSSTASKTRLTTSSTTSANMMDNPMRKSSGGLSQSPNSRTLPKRLQEEANKRNTEDL